MFKKSMVMVVVGLLAFSVQVRAQDEDEVPVPGTETDTKKTGDSPGPARFWQATVPGGNYQVALERISAVSRHKYLLDGAVIVDEVTVDTVGRSLVRFYFIAPLTDAAPGNAVANLAERGREMIDKAAQRSGVDVQNMVVKKYPDTTHAGTVEFRLQSAADLSALYSSVKTAWETGRGRQFTAK